MVCSSRFTLLGNGEESLWGYNYAYASNLEAVEIR